MSRIITSGKFVFTISSPNQSNELRTFFNISYTPKNRMKLSPYATNVEQKELINYFENWVKLIEEYNSIKVNPEDFFYKTYVDEYLNEFKILDENANLFPFDENKQLQIIYLLDIIESKLSNAKENDPIIDSLIEETVQLKNEVQSLTKSKVVSKLAILFAKIRKHGLVFLKEIYKEVKKEAIKKMITGGFEIIGEVTKHI